MTIATDNMTLAASRAETRVPMERRRAITAAMRVIDEYRDVEHAAALLLDSVVKQARWSGGLQGVRADRMVIDEIAEFSA